VYDNQLRYGFKRLDLLVCFVEEIV
jgi:hypothetical protein